MTAMHATSIISDKSLKAKQKASMLSRLLLDHPELLPELMQYAASAPDGEVATILEALEYASKDQPGVITGEAIDFAISRLSSQAARVKWEAAKVIGNAIGEFSGKAERAVPALLMNTDEDGTVVRWSMAYALGEIVKLDLPLNVKLIPLIREIIEGEPKGSIVNIYEKALKG